MKPRKKALLILLLPLLAFTAVHKFYLSVTNVGYSEKDAALQITSRIFIDDMQQVLLERYDINTELATENESKLADRYIEKYLRAKFSVSVNNENKPFVFIGKKYDNDVVVCYIEVPETPIETIKIIQIENEILTDLFDEQQNVLHFKINGQKKSFVLIKENIKGVLNL